MLRKATRAGLHTILATLPADTADPCLSLCGNWLAASHFLLEAQKRTFFFATDARRHVAIDAPHVATARLTWTQLCNVHVCGILLHLLRLLFFRTGLDFVDQLADCLAASELGLVVGTEDAKWAACKEARHIWGRWTRAAHVKAEQLLPTSETTRWFHTIFTAIVEDAAFLVRVLVRDRPAAHTASHDAEASA